MTDHHAEVPQIQGGQERQNTPMVSYYGLVFWYFGLAIAGALLATFAWFIWVPYLGLTAAVGVLAVSTTILLLGFAYTCWGWLSRMDHYPRTGFFAAGVSASLIVFMLFGASSIGLLMPMLFAAPLLARTIIAAATYITRVADLHHSQSQNEKAGERGKAKIDRLDFWAIVIGGGSGIVVAAFTIVTGGTISHVETLDFLAYVFVIIAGVASFGGLLNRLVGRNRMEIEIFGWKNFSIEAWIMRIVFLLAASMAGVLCILGWVPNIAATGLVTSSIGGVPFELFFGLGFAAACTSITDYAFLKTPIYVGYKFLDSKKCKDYIDQHGKKHEYRGAFVGIMLGLLLGITLLIFMITQPHVFTALVVADELGGKIFLSIVLVAAVSGAASRYFKTSDEREKIEAKDKDELPKLEELSTVDHTSEPEKLLSMCSSPSPQKSEEMLQEPFSASSVGSSDNFPAFDPDSPRKPDNKTSSEPLATHGEKAPGEKPVASPPAAYVGLAKQLTKKEPRKKEWVNQPTNEGQKPEDPVPTSHSSLPAKKKLESDESNDYWGGCFVFLNRPTRQVEGLSEEERVEGVFALSAQKESPSV